MDLSVFVSGSQNTRGTVTLNAAAGSSGQVVTLSSSSSAAVVPSSVTVAAGATSATFTITTSQVGSSTQLTITGSAGGETRTVLMRLEPRPLSASFIVTSNRGTDVCEISSTAGDLDCRFDGSASTGSIRQWEWTYKTPGNSQGEHASQESQSAIPNGCSLVGGSNMQNDDRGDGYVELTVTLTLLDTNGSRSSTQSKTVRMYTNRRCGFSN